ncbi:MAG: hypothetical protein ACAH89_03705 [Rariglobus sp.]
MIRLLIVLLFLSSVAHAADEDSIKIDVRLLQSLPEKRHAALLISSITDRDSSPDIHQKELLYIDTLKRLLGDLLHTYYWHSEFPNKIDEAIEARAIYLAGLNYPASGTTGCTAYDGFVRRYTISMYEEEIVLAAQAISRRLTDADIVTLGESKSFKEWKIDWDQAAKIKTEPNQAPEPTTLSVTPRAPSSTSRARQGRGSS